MTRRSAHQQRVLELKAKVMSLVANRLFTFKQTGIDGFLKRQLLTDSPNGAGTGSKTANE